MYVKCWGHKVDVWILQFCPSVRKEVSRHENKNSLEILKRDWPCHLLQKLVTRRKTKQSKVK